MLSSSVLRAVSVLFFPSSRRPNETRLWTINKLQRKRSDSPAPSCVSMKSDESMEPPRNFKNGNPSCAHSKQQRRRSDSPEPSCVSMKSDESMEPPRNFRNRDSSSVPRSTKLVNLELWILDSLKMLSSSVLRAVSVLFFPSSHRPNETRLWTINKLQRKRSDSPAPSCVSMKSDESMEPPRNFKNGNPSCAHSKPKRRRSDSPEPSCVSMKSDESMEPPRNFRNRDSSSVPRSTKLVNLELWILDSLKMLSSSVLRAVSVLFFPSSRRPNETRLWTINKLQRKRSDSPAPSCVSMKSDESMEPPRNFKNGNPSCAHSKPKRRRSDSPEPSCVSMKSDESMEPPRNFRNRDSSSVPRVLQKSGDRREKNIITATGHDPESAAVNEFQKKLKLNLMKKFQCLNGVIINQENRTLLNEIYTELYITEGDSGDVNKEHEVRQIEAASRRTTTEETPIKCNDIFKPSSEQDEPIRTVLTKGVAGIGKTVSVQKFILDWAEGKANQDLHFIFPLPFRELNLMKDQKLSLMDLLHVCFKETNETEMSSVKKVLFIFDGLDECRFPLDFQNTVRVCDLNESASVHVLLINLIKGNLLPSALIWITSRPAAAEQIPSEYVHRVTEIRGFNDPQKEEYLRKRISDQSLANNIITHLKSLRSLYIMCHIPVFCWISATVLERVLGEAESGEIPKTLTQMYTHFLIIQTNIIREKYSKKQESDEEMLLKLGHLAFQQLQKGNLIFYEEDLRECGIDVTEAAVYSGVCTQIFREEFGLHQSKVYCFVHLSLQEHLAALYVHLTFMKEKRNVLVQSRVFKTISDVRESAVDQALECASGHLDLFVRFLLGLSLESNQKLLHALVTQTGSSSQTENRKTVQYIKKKISRDVSTEKSINLFHCLNELGDNSLVEEIQRYLKSGKQRKLSSSQWSALVFVLLTSAQELEEFDLSKYTSTDKIREEIVVKVMPVIAASRKAIIRCDTIQERSWSALASVLNSDTSNLKELHLTVNTLDLSENKLGDSGVKNLSALLENPHCKVKHLRLRGCGVSDEGCAALTSALRSNPSHLRDLELSENNLGDSGVKCVSAVLENPHCKLEILCLRSCGVSDEGCAALASALRSNPSHLRELELSQNNLGDSGVKCLSAVLENPDCKLEILRLHSCGVSDEGCAALASALKSNPSHLRELYLCQNKLGESCGKCLSALLENPDCKLEKLSLRGCGVSDEGCAALASALRSNPSHLRHLELGENNLGDSGVKCLSAVLENPDCKLEILWLVRCGVSDEGCAALTSALRSNPSHLRDLDLSDNNLGDSGGKCLSAVLENPHCKLEFLWLRGCGVSDEGCAALTSALKSNPSHLRDLNLCQNNLGDSGVKCVSAVLENPHCKLEKLRLIGCGVSDEGCAALTSALRSNPSNLRDLDLSENNLGDSGVKCVSALLENPHCKLEILWLRGCGVSDEGCAALTSALKSNPSHLRELNLCQNKLGESCGKCLYALLENPHCKLEILRFCSCDVSDEHCAALTSALKSNPSNLRDLDLSGRNLGDSGVKCVSAVLENPHCKLEILRLRRCGVSDEGCAALASALRSNPSHLRDLELSDNNLGDSGVKCLSAVLENPHCKLEKLSLHSCGVSDEGCAALTSALRSNPSHLRHLELGENNLGDSGGKSLSAVLENPHCKLEILWLRRCGVSDEGCAALASALRSNPSHLRHLELGENNLGDSGVKCVSALLENPHCKLEILWLRSCGVSDEGCAALASALRSNPSHLRDLELSGNRIGYTGVKCLSTLKNDEHYKLQTLGFD
ncbi:NACHT, LRR and PYD domains-containing protein 14-like isoform X3 [Pangasianodon hypophthalmus]|uniref:NACHT, LRR and PYD domains-containing protein 14-like isoform X3 n=1 Tax=Pangasianodon hypophthalmus TaxID=310915 RepID=UPI0023070577|nr:NACHT, LRR and PYD domains-containing protein 14-like isoform X3 [Pangasianodon hypophthalmus]